MRHPRLLRAAAFALVSAAALSAGAEIYKYVDANGSVRFTSNLSEVPPSQRAAAEANAAARRRPAPQPPAAAAPPEGARIKGLMSSRFTPGAFSAWRQIHLGGTQPPAGAAGAKNGVWGVMMETGYEGGSSTLFARFDGGTDLMLSVGGGLAWGGDVERIRERSKRFVALAADALQQMRPVRETPLPRPGEVRFYLLTNDGVRGAAAARGAIGTGKHPLSQLFAAGDEVITALREESEAKGISL